MKDLKERLLYQYFYFSTPLGNAVTLEQRKEVFFSLAKAYLIDEESADELWNIVSSDSVMQIADQNAYLRYCRTRQYIKDILRMHVEDDIEAKVIALKGSVLSQALESGIIMQNEEGKDRIISNLVNIAGEGLISALRVLAIMQIHGVCVDKDMNSGLKNLNRTAKWNDVDGSMMYLYYCNDDRRDCFDRLLTSLEMRYNSSLIRALKEAYPQEAKTFRRNEIASLLEKAFNMSVLQREGYSAPKSRILYSEILSHQDKVLAIYSMDDNQRRSPICDLPLKLDSKKPLELNMQAFDGMVLNRPMEKNRILREAQNFDLRQMSNYRPMCLCADSSVLLQYYIGAIYKLVPNANVTVIEVNDLDKKDIDATSNNVFIRKCDEDKPNVYIVSFRGDISSEAMDLAVDFLRSSKRRTFGLTIPAVQIDLSSVLPICVCDKANESMLEKICNVITLESISKEEKGDIIDDLLERKAKLYGIEQIVIDKKVKNGVAKLSADNIAKALDKAILANRIKAGKLVLDESMLSEILEEFKAINKYGFGGSIQ